MIILKKLPRLRVYIAISFVILICLELFRYGWKYTPMSPQNYIFPDTKLTDYLKEDEINRIHFADVIPMNMWVNYGISSLGSYDAVYPERIARYISVNNSDSVNTGLMGRHAPLDKSNGNLVDIAGINRILSLSSEYEEFDSDTKQIFNDRSVYVYENLSALPRAKVFDMWEVENSDSKVLEKLLADNYPIADKLILFQEPDLNIITEPSGKKDLIIKKYSANEVEIYVDTDSDSLLFLSDTYYPGWEVYLDGVKSEIIRANYAFRAVPIRKGNHNIEFIYNPKSFRIGKWVSFVTLIFLLSVIYYEKQKRRSKPSRKRSS